jgi:hypothetical protein
VRRASNVRGAKGLGRAACVVCAFASVATAGDLLSDGVAWYEDDRRSIEQPIGRSPNLLRDKIHTTFVLPVRRHSSPSAGIRSIGSWVGRDKVPPAENVNALDEALNSTWFTNRIGLFPLTPEDAVGRPCSPLRGDERLRFGLLHLAHLGDAEKISEHAAAGARLKFRLAACGRIPSWCHASPWRFARSLSIQC